MSIDYLFELERLIDSGRELYACPGSGKNQWVIAKTVDELRKVAKRSADTSKMPVSIVRVISKGEAVTGDQFLVPVEIGDQGPRGEPQIKWKVVETRDAAEMFKDVRRGPPPYFGMQVEETVEPVSA